MYDSTDSIWYRMRFLVGGAIIVFGLLLLPIFTSLITSTPKVQAANSTSYDSTTEDSPNVITSGVFSASDSLSKSASSFANTVNNTANSTANTVANTASSITNSAVSASAASGKFIVHSTTGAASAIAFGAETGASFVAGGVGGTFGMMAHLGIKAFGAVAHPPAVHNIIKPADSDYVEVINKGAPSLPPSQPFPAQQANAVASAAQQPVGVTPIWPIHGTITTEFGASDWPYQLHHTGIDIADGKRAGITPIHPFLPGKVVQVIHSSVSLGNHVVVDNGNGITSVYGHMYSTNVQVGQAVDQNSVLGYVGSTGASTGPHVHFEIYLNGALQNPHNYVPGHP